jgi:hypothetical protein
MNRPFVALAAAALCACPPPIPAPDSGVFDSGLNPDPMQACSGGCAVNQICDKVNRVCVDACGGCGSDGGTPGICTRQPDDSFKCVTTELVCNGVACDKGQVACLADQCTCLGPARGTFDTCFGDPDQAGAPGEICGRDGTCHPPKTFDQCVKGSAACPTGELCVDVAGFGASVCTRSCQGTAQCDFGQICGTNTGCLPSGLFFGQHCSLPLDGGLLDDGGVLVLDELVAAGSICMTKDQQGKYDEPTPSGTCTYAFFYFADQGQYEFQTCRPAGQAVENHDCTQDPSITTVMRQCSTGLECAQMRGGDTGICLRTCNALEPSLKSPNPQPRCAHEDAGEVCINLYKREDINIEGALLGVCTQSCNVFDPVSSQCAPYGTTAASCVPTDPAGKVVLSADGSGVCMPQQASTQTLGMPCSNSDPFHGAVCATGQLCPPPQPNAQPVCTQVCDTGCVAGDGGTPARCATEVNALCPGGKTCTRVTTTLNARLGFCL